MQLVEGKPLRYQSMALVCVAVLALTSACGTAEPSPAGGQGAAPTPTYDPNEIGLTPSVPLPTREPPATPVPQPTPNPSDGVGAELIVEFAPPPTAEQFAQWFDLIVSGTVIQVLPPQWSTPDGKRPPGITQKDVPDTYLILTPVAIKLDGPPLVNRVDANVTSGVIVVATFGGQIGKDGFKINDPSQHLQMRQHLLLGLTDRPLLRGRDSTPYRYSTPAGLAWSVAMAYTLTNDGQATPGIPGAPSVDAQAFIAAIKAAASPEPTFARWTTRPMTSEADHRRCRK